MSTLPDNVARCQGSGSDEDGWREGCETCLRRTAPLPAPHVMTWMISPPAIITFWCPHEIQPDSPTRSMEQMGS